ncbi:hypothetical protein [Demequina sp.]|uniref:DUF7937 domain-containing protein n=1 Tax=Demequina sp. TaxID=2050685 RepID=UPI0025BBFA36|nr:hypothetical protein [Demequina sp.]
MTTEPTQPTSAGSPATIPNPFAGVPASDFARDGIALILLLTSLAMPWNLDSFAGTRGATDHIVVVLVTVLSLLSLALTYLARAQVFGPAVSLGLASMIRGAANVPYVLVVVIYLLIDASKGTDDWYLGGGIGAAMAFGLAGAILAGMPRHSETESLAGWQVFAMRQGAVGLAALWTVLSFLNLIKVAVGYRDAPGNILAMAVISVLIILVGLAATTLGLFLRSAAARVAVLAGALALLGTAVIDWWTDWDMSTLGIESFNNPALNLVPFLALGALISSPLVRSGMKPAARAERDTRAATFLMLVIAGIAGAVVIMTILRLIGDEPVSTGVAIGYIVTQILIAAAVLVATTFLRQNFAGARMMAIAVVGGTIIIGIVSLVLVNKISDIARLDIVLHIGLPLAIITLLALSSRSDSAKPKVEASASPAAASPAAPVPPVPPAPPAAPAAAEAAPAEAPAPEAPSHPRADEAADPATSAQALHEIATTVPELRPVVAANPSAYPELLDWMGQLGEPAVDAQIAKRNA